MEGLFPDSQARPKSSARIRRKGSITRFPPLMSLWTTPWECRSCSCGATLKSTRLAACSQTATADCCSASSSLWTQMLSCAHKRQRWGRAQAARGRQLYGYLNCKHGNELTSAYWSSRLFESWAKGIS